MTSKLIVNSLAADTGVSTITFADQAKMGNSLFHSTGFTIGDSFLHSTGHVPGHRPSGDKSLGCLGTQISFSIQPSERSSPLQRW